MPDPREALARIRAQADAATEGPWEADGLEGVITSKMGMPITDPQKPRLVVDGITMWAESDAEFIAAARTTVPALLDALEAVLDLHAADEDGDCAECIRRAQGRGDQSYPCPTAAAAILARQVEAVEKLADRLENEAAYEASQGDTWDAECIRSEARRIRDALNTKETP